MPDNIESKGTWLSRNLFILILHRRGKYLYWNVLYSYLKNLISIWEKLQQHLLPAINFRWGLTRVKITTWVLGTDFSPNSCTTDISMHMCQEVHKNWSLFYCQVGKTSMWMLLGKVMPSYVISKGGGQICL